LFQQLFNQVGRTLAYDNPLQAATDDVHAAIYLAILRNTSLTIGGVTKNGIQAIKDFTGVDLGATGTPLIDPTAANPDLTKITVRSISRSCAIRPSRSEA